MKWFTLALICLAVVWNVEAQNATGCGGDPNAVFDPCGDPCPKTCNNKDKGLICKAPCIVGGGCKCKPGYFRNIWKKCIEESKCPKCGQNEFFDCGSACDTTCATLGEVCPIVNVKCNEKCYCISGFARDANNKCIPVTQCPPKVKCGTNEEFLGCPSPCPPEKTCDSLFSGIEPLCPVTLNPPTCIPACRCKNGFFRNNQKKCVLPPGCCTDPNSELVNNPNCCPGGTCAIPSFIPCKMKCPQKGCQCKPGFLKKSDTDETCISRSKCPTIKPIKP